MPLRDGETLKLPSLAAGMFFLLFNALLSSCAVLNKLDVFKQPELLPMAPPVGPSRRVVQQITVLWQDRKETFLCVLELDEQRIAVAGLTNEGVSLFNLTYDGKTTLMDKSALLPNSLAPEVIITDLQLVYWPVTVIQQSLSASSWRLEADIDQRRLYYQDNKMVEVHYLSPDPVWAKSVELINYRDKYHLQIKTISYEALPE
jgi:hypothetical protein